MIPESEIEVVLNQILNSPEFHESKRHRDLLKFLVQESFKSEPLKETTIAHEFFAKDSSFDPTKDTSVRAYISALRRKLEHYYLTTQDVYLYKLEIPKGQYHVQFTKVSFKDKKRFKIPATVFISAILILLIIIIIQWIFLPKENTTQLSNYKTPNPIWEDILRGNEHPIMLVFGDYVFLSEKESDSNREIFIRDPAINSENDFRRFIKDNPDYLNKYSLLNFTYLRQSAYLGMAEIIPTLLSFKKKIELKSASQLKWQDFETHNIIFIGPLKTLHILNSTLKQTTIKFNIYPPDLFIVNEKGDTISNYQLRYLRGGNYQKDYGTLIKLEGPNKNKILILAGFGEAGVMDAVKLSIDPQLISKINKYKKPTIRDSIFNFELVTELEGVDQTVFHSVIKYFNQINSSIDIKKEISSTK